MPEIEGSAFNDCQALTSVNIPASVKSIGSYAFYSCQKLPWLMFPDDITYIGPNAFWEGTKLNVYDKTRTLLALWEAGYTPYLMKTETLLKSPSALVEATTQTTVTVKIENYLEGYVYSYGGQEFKGDKVELKNLYPDVTTNAYVGMSLGEVYPIIHQLKFEYTTKPITPTITVHKTASSVDISVSYQEGDAKVSSQRLVKNPSYVSKKRISGGTDVEGLAYSEKGLEPNSYVGEFAYEVVVGDGSYTVSYITQVSVNTDALTLITQQPKVVSVGNVIVAADSNLDDEEENVGFEWRRTDWTDEFASNTGKGALFEGRMEGYIRNMNAEKLWKYRPYYLSAAGTYYYGDWVGLDPSNTSYFEPTVHTYEKTVIEGNTALVKGYALAGTDKITVQGFKYWKQTVATRGDVSVPSDAITVEAQGQVMTASLTNLDFGATYQFLSFATTSEGETFYGELKEFVTASAAGDANGDGTVDKADVEEVANYIMGKASDAFNKEAADVNGDGTVNAADIVVIVNIINNKK